MVGVSWHVPCEKNEKILPGFPVCGSTLIVHHVACTYVFFPVYKRCFGVGRVKIISKQSGSDVECSGFLP